jgi:hypothetical protein
LLPLVRTLSASFVFHVFPGNRVAWMGAPGPQFPQLVLRVLALVVGRYPGIDSDPRREHSYKDITSVSPRRWTWWSASAPDVKVKLDQLREKYRLKALELEEVLGSSWNELVAKAVSSGQPIPPELQDELEPLIEVGIRTVRARELVRRDVISALDHVPSGWIRTPSIVVSRNETTRLLQGGHNIGGRATRVVIDPSIPKGQVTAGGSYKDGRVLRLNPADEGAEQDVVRLFDREVGIRDESKMQGIKAAEARLKLPSSAPSPIRPVAEAMQMPSTRAIRGASPDAQAMQIGYQLKQDALVTHPQIEGIIGDTGADVVVAASPPSGYVVVRAVPTPPTALAAPNVTSMYEAVETTVRQVSLGPPPIAEAEAGV